QPAAALDFARNTEVSKRTQSAGPQNAANFEANPSSPAAAAPHTAVFEVNPIPQPPAKPDRPPSGSVLRSEPKSPPDSSHPASDTPNPAPPLREAAAHAPVPRSDTLAFQPQNMTAAADYFDRTLALLQAVRETQLPAIEQAAEICARSISHGGLVFLFGAGHSRMMCEEITPRQGGFVGFFSLVELSLSTHSAIVGANGLRAPLYLEKYEGYAEEILKSFHFGPHDAFIVISTSGIRPVIVEM